MSRRVGRRRPAEGLHRKRILIGRAVLVLALVVAAVKLADVQTLRAPALSARAEQQRATEIDMPADRGTITDRNGVMLAFSVDIDALSYQPERMRKTWDQAAAKGQTDGIDFTEHTAQIADFLAQRLGSQVDRDGLLAKLRSGRSFVYLDEHVDPAVAKAATQRFPDIAVEHRAQRQYPNGSVACNIVGAANWRKDRQPQGVHGLLGLESSLDRKLAGTPGKELVDTESGNNRVVIPGTERLVRPARPGEDVQLTLDTDLQYEVQRMLRQYVHQTGARGGSAVVLDVHTGQVYALANDNQFDPNDLSTLRPGQLGDAAVTTPFEPGSVNKIVVAAAAVAAGLVQPDTPIRVPSTLPVADTVIHDDWWHPDQTFTVTGILAKSSNIGADVLARKVGPKRFMAMVHKMGLGQQTGIALPGESGGYVPPRDSWSGTTFANLPIGQGLSMTVLQMAGMYQAVANGGLRIPPRIIKSVTKPDGTVVPTPQPAGVRVLTPEQAGTVMEIISHVTQDRPSPQRGTAVPAALPGYNIAGKTGTAQQVVNGHYSPSKITTTFVGILPANAPRFVAGIMLDAPKAGEGGTTAAPLFHHIAAYLAQRYSIPTSPKPVPNVPFVLQ